MNLMGSRPRPKRAPPVINSDRYLGDADVARIAERYKGAQRPVASYGTVRDYCDSVDVIGPLATSNRDMKDLQRCWTLKALLAHAPRGERLLEIGAGEPLVADVLARAGYDVTVFDPYDGFGGGPAVGDAFTGFYPRLKFRRETFGDATGGLDPASFAACYSISVLEHVSPDERDAIFRGVRKFLRPDGVSVHSIDHVLLGAGSVYHRDGLLQVGGAYGVPPDAIDGLLDEAAADPDTYLVSAEAHDGWRKGRPYDEFPMRRIVSVQFCGPLRPAGAR